MLTLLYAVRYGVGVLFGLGVGLLLAMVWNFLAPAIAEWLVEVLHDRKRRPEERLEPIREVLVSDLHIDTWNYAPQVEQRAKSFVEFLQTVRDDDRISGFILNGDLMDIPLFAGKLTDEQNRLMLEVKPGKIGPDQGVIGRNYLPVLQELFNLEKPRGHRPKRVIFQTGNHDIGVVGLRYVLLDMPEFLPGVQAGWSPQILLMGSPDGDDYDRRCIYIEHGQEYDPLLWLYMRYAVLDLLRGGHLHRESHFVEAMQRRGQTGFGPSAKGSTKKASIRAQAARSGTMPADMPTEELPVARPEGREWDYADDKHTVGEWLLIRRYRWAARMAFWTLPRRHRDRVKTVTFGHTHKPDRYVFPDGRVYINSGAWAGYSTDQSYCLIHKNGFVTGPYQWVDAATFRRRHVDMSDAVVAAS